MGEEWFDSIAEHAIWHDMSGERRVIDGPTFVTLAQFQHNVQPDPPFGWASMRSVGSIPANTRRWLNVDSMLARHLRFRANNETLLGQRLVCDVIVLFFVKITVAQFYVGPAITTLANFCILDMNSAHLFFNVGSMWGHPGRCCFSIAATVTIVHWTSLVNLIVGWIIG